jgi:hypothetical protein
MKTNFFRTRPWWDNFEDFLVYGLVMLGLIVAPTAIINGGFTWKYCAEYFQILKLSLPLIR